MFYGIAAAVAVFIVIFDQVFKTWICNTLALGDTIPFLSGLMHLTRLHNYGAAFSIFVGQRWPLIVITILYLAVVVLLLRKKVLKSRGALIGLAMVTGGAIGNLIDRFRFGYVVDMFALDLFEFPVFNIADIFVVCGAIVFCIFFLLEDRKEPKA